MSLNNRLAWRSVLRYCTLCFVLFATSAAWAETWQGVCTSVIDGDSLIITRAGSKTEIRLYGIDAPEFDQPFGKQARACARELVLRKKVTVEEIETDRYGRTIARVHIPQGCVNEILVARGCAWVYERYCTPEDRKAWSALERKARDQRLGLWALPDPVAPWDHRRSRREAAAREQARAPVSGYYRGNTASFVFHAPDCTYYACKNCRAGFNSIGEAMRAGYTSCRRCINN